MENQNAFFISRPNSSHGTKENLQEPSRRCDPNTSGPSGANSKQREERAILRCSTWPSIVSSGPAMLLH